MANPVGCVLHRATRMLEIRQLTGGWGPTTVIEDFSLVLKPGETVSIIGRNGVGKSMLLELIVGRARTTAGRILFKGMDIKRHAVFERARSGIGYVPQQREVFPNLTVLENLTIARNPGAWTLARLMDLFPGLARRANSLGRQLSGGEQQMLSIARAMIGNPSLLLMDEPSEGLAPVLVEQLVAAMKSLVGDEALAVLLVEQRVDVAMDLSSRCVVMDRGRIVHECASETLRDDPGRISRVMGLEAAA